jgi:spore coat polysaccharide biosynthesis protein SpsF
MVVEPKAIVTVRNSSTRLPNKAIMKIKNDLSSIDIVIKRAKKSGFPVVLATSTDVQDNVFVGIAQKHHIEIFRGSLLNKIKRWYDCFNKLQIEHALLVDGDDLSYDYDVAKRAMLQLHTSKDIDIVASPKETVCGFFTYAITKNAISKLYSLATDDSLNTDVITKYIELAKLNVSYVSLEQHEKNKDVRLTLDYNEDLEFFRELYRNVDVLDNGKTIIKFLEANKSVSQINFHRQKDFLANQAKFNEGVK